MIFDSAEGPGTQCDVYLPALDSREKADLEGVPATPLGSGQTVLVIDDDVSILQITRQILESYEYKVLSANSGVAALEAVGSGEHGPIKVVLTDLDMPTLGGAAVVSALRQTHGDVPVIIMSGLPPSKDSPEVARLGVQGIIGKPFRAEDLLTLIRDVLDA